MERRFFDNREGLRSAYDRLGSAEKVADFYGVSKKCILNHMKRLGIARKNRRYADGALVDMLLCLAQGGMSLSKLSRVSGFSAAGISQMLAKRGFSAGVRYHKGHIRCWNGYIRVSRPDHPFCDGKGYVLEHRLVMEAFLGRYLDDFEKVHHCDGNKSNNEIENLDLISLCEHTSMHHRGKSKKKSVGKI